MSNVKNLYSSESVVIKRIGTKPFHPFYCVVHVSSAIVIALDSYSLVESRKCCSNYMSLLNDFRNCLNSFIYIKSYMHKHMFCTFKICIIGISVESLYDHLAKLNFPTTRICILKGIIRPWFVWTWGQLGSLQQIPTKQNILIFIIYQKCSKKVFYYK